MGKNSIFALRGIGRNKSTRSLKTGGPNKKKDSLIFNATTTQPKWKYNSSKFTFVSWNIFLTSREEKIYGLSNIWEHPQDQFLLKVESNVITRVKITTTLMCTKDQDINRFHQFLTWAKKAATQRWSNKLWWKLKRNIYKPLNWRLARWEKLGMIDYIDCEFISYLLLWESTKKRRESNSYSMQP